MHKASIKTQTGIDKNGKNWYGVIVKIEKFETEMQFVDQIHYEYLKTLEAQTSASGSTSGSKPGAH